ncbi:MAG: choline kinase, partial [Bacteroidota bacterium]
MSRVNLKQQISDELSDVIAFDAIREVEQIQQLWSGYGQLLRVNLVGASVPSVIVKRIFPPQTGTHPRG